MNKICRQCGEKKQLIEFPIQKTIKDGRHSYCKSCNNIRIRAYRKNNPEEYEQHKNLTAKKLSEKNKRIKIERYIKFLEENGYDVKRNKK